jgi:tetratricopeptide (TPR) repeat protein
MTVNRRFKLALRQLALLCAGGALLACSAPPVGPPSLVRSAAPAADADGYYALGRSHYVARRYGAARDAYLRALALVPGHVDARNGLATVHAARGELAPALDIWRSLTAEAPERSGKDTAFLFNNLGYAYLLAGDAAQAASALERACVLDPLDYRAWENLGEALHRLGEHDRAQQVAGQADTLRRHDLKADYAAVGATPAAMVEPASTAEPDFAAAEVHLGGARAVADRLALPALPSPAGVALLEISNGNGVKGMAAALGRSVDRSELRVVRLSNQRGFAVARTRIEFQQGQAEAARKLAARFRQPPQLQLAKVDGVAIRLVIGHDLVQDKAWPRLAGL